MKSITLTRASIDNAGRFKDAGSALTVADGTEPDTISATRADELVASHGAAPDPELATPVAPTPPTPVAPVKKSAATEQPED